MASFLEWTQALTKKDAAGNFVQAGVNLAVHDNPVRVWHTWLHQAGGQFIDENNKAAMNSEAGRESLQFTVDLHHKYEVSSRDEVNLQEGTLDINYVGPWMVKAYLDAGLNYRTAVTPVIWLADRAFGSPAFIDLLAQEH